MKPVTATAPSQSNMPERNGWATLGTLIPYLWPKGQTELRLRVMVAIVFLVVSKIFNVYVPILYKQAVDSLGGSVTGHITDAATLAAGVPIAIILAYGGARVLALGFSEVKDAVFAKVSARAIRQVALTTFEHLHRLALRFHLDRRTGGMVRSIERGTAGIEFLLTFMLFNILPTLIEIVLVCGILWALFNLWFALVTLVTIIGYIAFTLIITEWRTKYRREMNATNSEANSKSVDSLLNYETVKYFNNEGHEAARYEVALAKYERASIHSKVTLSLLNLGQAAIISIGLAMVMVMAGRGVVDHTMTVGDFVLVNTYLIQLYIPLNFLGFVYREMRQSLIDMEEMFKLLRINAEVQDSAGAKPLAMPQGVVSFEHVSFGYDIRRPILKDVSFTVGMGKTVAIVGPSGAGKSTISRLLFRFYDVDTGRITIDGQDIRDITQASLRKAIGIVPQDTVLFNDTIYYNIAYGNPSASKEQVEQAAKLARIHDMIMSLPDQYQAMVGERGLKLSGGEKQRVAIARTILKNPGIFLFDEATSALDTKTEQEIQASLRELSKGHTTLVIAHRLSTIVDADEILVLDDGAISERGTHDALLALNGTYAAM
ncbi:MAG: ABC transporter ATP-binding protein/permease, partial [Alphaproteobacteria bacterium]|nr:ABC transporter ATP-binding protein/permease [Alphaproteobacteria bacterium]